MRRRLIDALLIALVLIAVGILLAAGGRIVDLLVGEDSPSVWKVALALVGSAVVGGIGFTVVRRRNGDDDG